MPGFITKIKYLNIFDYFLFESTYIVILSNIRINAFKEKAIEDDIMRQSYKYRIINSGIRPNTIIKTTYKFFISRSCYPIFPVTTIAWS